MPEDMASRLKCKIQLIKSKKVSKRGQGKNPAPGVIATIVTSKCTEKKNFTLYGRFARGGGSKTSTHFF
jgi:hypothetical protein